MADSQLITPPFAKKRIEYLDALRGFTMLLVVMTHVAGLVFGSDGEGGNYHFYLKQFRIPLFFFVSGFVFYKNNYNWSAGNIMNFLKKKIPVQLIFPFLFMLCYTYTIEYDFIEALILDHKRGYWFTFTLFAYFVIYILSQKIFDAFKVKTIWRFAVLLITGFVIYNNFVVSAIFRVGVPSYMLTLLGITKLNFFIFFVIGAFVKKYFQQFEYLLDKTLLVAVAIAVYFLVNIFIGASAYNDFVNNGINFVLALCGIVIVFSWFRKNGATFAGDGRVSRTLKFIGKRTLDIYLLHYFFMPYDLYKVFPFFMENSFPILEFAATFTITIFVVAACLVVSSVLRINDTLAHYMFGAKK